jgi:hypothetical protein
MPVYSFSSSVIQGQLGHVKRTAFELADSLLREYGYYFDRSDKDEIIRVMIRIAEYDCPEDDEIDTISKWVQRKVRKLV